MAKLNRNPARSGDSEKSAVPLGLGGKGKASERNEPPASQAINPHGGIRDNIEQLLVALILALLFRSFEAEAFVIPTGSMAPTLVGRHHDIYCEQCQHRFQSGDSLDPGRPAPLVSVVCPLCRFENPLEDGKASHVAFAGDRILVNKYVYEFSDPQRWDVIVFKFPGCAKQNYIKRLIGLPNETLKISSGDIYVKSNDTEKFAIARKPSGKLEAMLQLVHDTDHIPKSFIRLGWPSSWFAAVPSNAVVVPWKVSPNQNQFSAESSPETAWLHFRNLLPTASDWNLLQQGKLPENANTRLGELVTDFYGYNATRKMGNIVAPSGWHWVGDLAVEAAVKIQSPEGDLYFEIIEGGEHLQCHIDVTSGRAELSINNGQDVFEPLEDGKVISRLEGQTPIRGTGEHQIRFANFDNQLRLWIDGEETMFAASGNTHMGGYVTSSIPVPKWSETDPGDLNPIRIGVRNLKAFIPRIEVFRDIYYVAVADPQSSTEGVQSEYRPIKSFQEVKRVMGTPSVWNSASLFRDRQEEQFSLDDDQFLPMGDNSPCSSDGRLWRRRHPSAVLEDGKQVENFVGRELLIGKAFLIYWPHGWNLGPIPVPIVPNVSRMERIK